MRTVVSATHATLVCLSASARVKCASGPRPACLQASASEAPVSSETKKLWGGRFTGATDPLMEKFNESLPFDKRMWAEDIRVRACLSSRRALPRLFAG